MEKRVSKCTVKGANHVAIRIRSAGRHLKLSLPQPLSCRLIEERVWRLGHFLSGNLLTSLPSPAVAGLRQPMAVQIAGWPTIACRWQLWGLCQSLHEPCPTQSRVRTVWALRLEYDPQFPYEAVLDERQILGGPTTAGWVGSLQSSRASFNRRHTSART